MIRIKNSEAHFFSGGRIFNPGIILEPMSTDHCKQMGRTVFTGYWLARNIPKLINSKLI